MKILKKLAFKIKVLYNKYKDWRNGISCPEYAVIRLKLGQKLQDGDILHNEVIYTIGKPGCKIKAVTVIDQYLLTFKPTRKIKIGNVQQNFQRKI